MKVTRNASIEKSHVQCHVSWTSSTFNFENTVKLEEVVLNFFVRGNLWFIRRE